MINFEVIVKPMSVKVVEVHRMNKHHARARVDGMVFAYKIRKDKVSKPLDRGWFERGLRTCHYHANNSGEAVEFEPVYAMTRAAKKKVSNHQKSLFG